MKSPRRYGFLLLLLTTLVCLTGGSFDCRHDVVVEGVSKRPMAQATVERFLFSLRSGDYETAARCFAGPFEVLHATTVGAVDPANPQAILPERLPGTYQPSLDETASWLEMYVKRYPACVHDFEVGAEKMIEPHTFTVDVEFRLWDREPIIEQFQIGYDGKKYWVLGLPPIFPES